MSVRVSGSRLTSESCSDRKKTCSTLVSTDRCHTVLLKTTKCKGNRIRNCHIISNSFSTVTPSSTLTKRWYSSFWKTWPPVNLIDDCIKLNRLSHFGLKSTHTTKSSWKFLFLSWRQSRCCHLQNIIFRRGNPMEVMDDCTVFFLGILPHTLPTTDKRSSPSSHFTSNRDEKFVSPPKKPVVLKFLDLSLSTMPLSLSWLWIPRIVVLKLNSWQTYVVLNSAHCNQGRSWRTRT
jgi:hypothetical protein